MDKCDFCDRDARPQQCTGDHSYHHHGMVHTMLRGSTNDLAPLCDDHARRDQEAWGMWRHGIAVMQEIETG